MSIRLCATACILTLVSGATPGPSPVPTVLASTRFTIDRFNQWSLDIVATDAPDVSIGSRNRFGDAGTLVSTAVLIQTPATSSWFFAASRIDLLLYARAPPATRRDISDFVLSLYSDDGSAAHNPGVQVTTARSPLSAIPLPHALAHTHVPHSSPLHSP